MVVGLCTVRVRSCSESPLPPSFCSYKRQDIKVAPRTTQQKNLVLYASCAPALAAQCGAYRVVFSSVQADCLIGQTSPQFQGSLHSEKNTFKFLVLINNKKWNWKEISAKAKVAYLYGTGR